MGVSVNISFFSSGRGIRFSKIAGIVVINLIVCYGRLSSTMDDVLAAIFDAGE